MIPQEIIRKKINKENLLEEEVKLFVQGLTDGSFSDPQIAAMSMAIFLNKMSEQETVWMTHAMTNSGDILNWENIVDSDLVCDKHSTGGVGDKVSLILAPILAACELYIPMISGRGLGHTGGTLDKFDSIPGYNTQPNLDTFIKVVKEVGCAVIGQTSNLAPADKKLYSIRDIVGTIESIPLITSSILSKKIASGLKSLVLDVKVGNGSFNKNIGIATNLANSLVSVAKGAGLNCEAILTDMNQILGWNAGHSLEVEECIEYLLNLKKNKRLEKITNELATTTLLMTKKITKTEALDKINKVINSGKAAEKFEKMIALLGGPSDFLKNYKSHLKKANYVDQVLANKTGFINSIQTRNLGLILIELGGGRKQMNDKINFSIGYENVINVGQAVNASTVLVTVHANSKNDFEKAEDKIQRCFEINDEKSDELLTIYKNIN